MPGPCRVLAGSAMQPQTPWMLSQAPTDSLRTDEAAAVRWRPDDLSGEAPGDFRHVASEIAFLAHHGVPVEVLAAATRRGSLLGVAPEDILIREGHCSEEFFYRSLADELGLGFRTTFTVLRAPSSSMLSRCELAEIDSDAGCDFVIAPRGKLIGNLLGARGRALAETHRIAVTTPTRLSRAILHRSGRAVASAAAAAPLGDAGRWSAKAFPHRNQQAGFAGLAGAILTMAWISPDAAWLLASGVLALSFVLQGGLRAASLLAGSRPVPKRPPQLPDSALPRYTVLVPLYREGRVLRRLVQALADLDYPAGKLDIKILVEADDQETWREAQRLALQPPFEVVICPPGLPRTKPRALNIGLGLGHGELLVVYDAEDRPDRNQLRLAAARFAASPPRVACLQASLAIDNADESWLTRHFALEYAQLFDVTVPGMASLSLPIPLGGTSNHFRVEALLAAGAWDAWNVTEDADLGLRLARLGYRVGKLESTTWEEAPVTLRPWLRQRTRWLKGWMQTSMVHGCQWRAGLRDVGLVGLVALYAQTIGLVLAALGWPFFTAGLFWHVGTGSLFAPGTWSAAIIAVLEPTVAVLGVAIVLWAWALGAAVRGIRLKAADVVLLPLYILLVSGAGWCAVADLIHAPFRWTKTEHGVARRRTDRRLKSPVPG
jgi:glycosyltransferase XagB